MATDLKVVLNLNDKQFSDAIKKAITEVNTFKNNMNKSAKSITDFTNLLKYGATALAGLQTAYTGLEKVMNSNARTQLEWQSSLEGACTSVNQFFQSLISGDWGTFEDGILNAIGLAKEYQKQMKLAKQAAGINKSEAELYEGQRNNYEHIITSDNASKAEKEDAYIKYAELSAKEISVRERDINNAKEAIASMLKANSIESITTPEELQKFIFTYANPSTSEYQQLQTYLKDMDEKKAGRDLMYDAMINSRGISKDINEEYQKANKAYTEARNDYLEEMARLQGFLVDEEMSKVVELLDIVNENTDKIGTIKKDMDDAKTDITKVATGNKTNNASPVGSLAELNKQISTKKTELGLAISNEDRIRINQELEALTEKKRVIEFHYKYPNAPTGDLPKGQSLSSVVSMPDMKDFKIENPIKKQDIKLNNDYADSLNAIASVMGSVSNMTNEGAAAWLTWGANTVTAIAMAIPQIQTLIAAKTAEAGASAVASAAQTPFVGWLLAGAAVASVLAAIASLPSFSTGGIYAGNSTVGDVNLARVNAGEMILNNRQQRNLFNLLNGNGTLSNGGNGEVKFRISGKELVGVLSNYNNKMSKVL